MLAADLWHLIAISGNTKGFSGKTQGSPTGKSSSAFDVFALSRFAYASRDVRDVRDVRVVPCVSCGACDVVHAT